MSKQYLQAFTLPETHATDVFSIAVTSTHVLTASGSSAINVYRCSPNALSADIIQDESPCSLSQTLNSAHKLGCHHVCASGDGKLAASVGFGTNEISVWASNETDGWAALSNIAAERNAGEFWAIALDGAGQHLACTTFDGRIEIYDPRSQSQPEKLAAYETKGSFGMSVDISSNGELTASGHQNGGVYIFNNSTRRLAHALSGLLKPVRAVKFSPANTFLAAAGDARIIALYDTRSGEQVATFSGHNAWIMSLDWNWNGEYLLSGGHDGKVKVWSIERRECVATQTESEKCLWGVKWLHHAPNARNEVFVTAGAERMLAFYREASGI